MSRGKLNLLEALCRQAGKLCVLLQVGELTVYLSHRGKKSADNTRHASSCCTEGGKTASGRVDIGKRLLNPANGAIRHIAGLIHVAGELVQLRAKLND